MQSKKLCKRDGGAGGRSLPEDILYEVLLRQPLPPKALHRFRSVCKGWRTLISDHAFQAERRSRASADPFIVAMFGTAQGLDLRLLDMDGNVVMVFHVRGGTAAFLAPTRLDLIFVDMMHKGALIIDPASAREDFIAIVGTNDTLPTRYTWGESRSTAVDDYSFGRAVPSGDYKILRLHASWDGQRGCEVSTVLDDGAEPTWRRRPWGPFSQTGFSCEHKATVKGDLYFMRGDTNSASHDRKLIAIFNLETEVWRPKKIKGLLLGRKNVEDKWRIGLTELKGTLCMVHNVQSLTHSGVHYANLWILKDPNRSVWVKEYKIQMSEEGLLFTKPLDVLLDGTLFLLNTFHKAGNNEKCHRHILQFYSSSTNAFTDLMEMGEGFNGRMAFYTGSLQS